MPTLLAKVASLVTKRSDSDDPCMEDVEFPSCTSAAQSNYKVGLYFGIGWGLFVFFTLLLVLAYFHHMHLRESNNSISNYFRPSSQFFIFRRCCGKKRKHGGPLEQDYQPYEMMRPQGQHLAEAGFNKGFDDIAVSEA